jgi:hypothetical protein
LPLELDCGGQAGGTGSDDDGCGLLHAGLEIPDWMVAQGAGGLRFAPMFLRLVDSA